MPAKNVELIKIWRRSYDHLKELREAYKARGDNSMSMTLLASQAILSLPMPNGNAHEQAPCKEEE
jgi:hypothetical protein